MSFIIIIIIRITILTIINIMIIAIEKLWLKISTYLVLDLVLYSLYIYSRKIIKKWVK